jgi:putative tricarboxylic transport membrane protein
MITDRLSGAFFFLVGLALYFHVVPNYVDRIDYGAIYPATMPSALAIVLAIGGALLIVRPTHQRAPDAALLARATLYLAVLAAGVYAMSWLGFVYTAPPLALVIMLLIGERRPLWLMTGVAVMPFLIWLVIKILLDRSLP